jgi:uncharacterized membrane protein HdeD (DUF308 family)
MFKLDVLRRDVMASSEAVFEDGRTIRDVLRTHSRLFLAQGVIVTLLGFVAVIWPNISSIAVDFYVGWVFLLSGVAGLATMFFAPNAAGFLWSLVTAALALFAGILLLWHPVEGVVSLTLVLTSLFVAEGLFQIVTALGYRSALPESWGWMLLSGLADLALAALIMAGWPSTATWALGLFVGLNLISTGLAMIFVATTASRVMSKAEKALQGG